MSMSAGDSGGVNSDINVTPMIDVLLVLLIIFMITQPLSRMALDVQVPPLEQAKSSNAPSNQIVLELTDDGG
ncbi:MAG: biopolymer transporter ExbD, partial [Gemmatimonadota bacterium]